MKTKINVLMALLLMLCAIAGNAKKVHTLGDSTMAPYDENATNTRGWGMYFGNFLTNGWTSVNYAKGGRDSRGGYNELWNNAKNNVQAGDYVLIQFAHNDEKYNGIDNLELQAYYTAKGDASNASAVKSDGRGTTPSTTYKECLTQIINAVKAKGATPVLVSAVCRCYFGSDNKITRPGRHDLGDKYDAIVNGELKTGQTIAASDHTIM
jgi:lysophospholipase L1-like esterase